MLVNSNSRGCELNKANLLIADKYKHRATSSLFALLDVTKHQRHVFYKHMGHNESINQNVYEYYIFTMVTIKISKYKKYIF